MSIAQISRKAKAIRKQRPGMSWHNAQKAAAAALRGGSSRKRTRSAPVAGLPARRRKSRRISGIGSTAAVSAPRRRRKRKAGWFGATATVQGRMMQIGEIAAGMAVGAAGTHLVLRPIEHKITEHFKHPYVKKAMPWGEIALGGMAFIMSGNKHIRHIGLGVMSAGVSGAMQQLPFHLPSPGGVVNGMGDYTTLDIPINGTVADMISGLIQEEGFVVQTPVVGEYEDDGFMGASILRDKTGPVFTPVVGHDSRYLTVNDSPVVGYGGDDEDDDQLFYTNHFNR